MNLSYTRIFSGLFNSEEQQLISHTTSQYPLKHTQTTQEEVAAPGKLPETPLRMDPDLLYDTRYDYEFEVEPTHHIQMETPPKEVTSSYSVRCAVPFHEHRNSADVLLMLNSSFYVSVSPLPAGCVSLGGGGEGASEALQLRVTAPLFPDYVGGGDRRGGLGRHRQDPGPHLPSLRAKVSCFLW